MVEKEIYQKIIIALQSQNYRIDAQSFSYEDVNIDHDLLAKRIRLGIDAINFISIIFDLDFEPKLKAVFNNERFKEDIKKIYPITNFVLFKFFLTQPVVIALVNADELESSDFKTITNQYDSLILNFRKYTGEMFGTKFSVVGLIVFIFSDSNKALQFEEKYQSENKLLHFWKKTWTIAWGIDIKRKKVISHKGIPVLVGMINAKKMEVDVFQE